MISLIYVLSTVSALTGQLYSNPACNGPGCQSNSASGSTRSLLTSRQIVARQDSQFGVPLLTAACQCRTCDPRIPCSPENCARQDCAECVDGCQNCVADRLARPVNDVGASCRQSAIKQIFSSHRSAALSSYRRRAGLNGTADSSYDFRSHDSGLLQSLRRGSSTES